MAGAGDRRDDRSAAEKLPDDLLHAFNNISSSGSFAACGSLFTADLVDLGLAVEGLGAVDLPLKPIAARILLDLSQEKHGGGKLSSAAKSTVGGFWNVDPSLISLAPAWGDLLCEAVAKAKEGMGWPSNTK